MDTNLPALIAAAAASLAVVAHGVVGHRWFMAQLGSVQMQPTRLSTRLFGDSDVSQQVFGVTWHSVTAMFLASAVALYLSAFEVVESRELLRFIAIIHAAFLGVGLVYIVQRPDVLRQLLRAPITPTFVISMAAAASLAWIASNSV